MAPVAIVPKLWPEAALSLSLEQEWSEQIGKMAFLASYASVGAPVLHSGRHYYQDLASMALT